MDIIGNVIKKCKGKGGYCDISLLQISAKSQFLYFIRHKNSVDSCSFIAMRDLGMLQRKFLSYFELKGGSSVLEAESGVKQEMILFYEMGLSVIVGKEKVDEKNLDDMSFLLETSNYMKDFVEEKGKIVSVHYTELTNL